MKEILTKAKLYNATKEFCASENKCDFPDLVGVSDGKAIGTFVENRLKHYLAERYELIIGNSASGIDLPSPEINTDIKVTSYR
jgi:hypothetical protein